MRKLFVVSGIIIVLIGLGLGRYIVSKQTNMEIRSASFQNESDIPPQFSCDGANKSPGLNWSGQPEGTKSFVLIMDDPDIPAFVKQKMGIEVFDHWVLYNIPASAHGIAEGQSEGVQGKNSSGGLGYTGPCPPDREHRYFFRLYALDAELALPAGASRQNVDQAMRGHIMAEAGLMGRYARNN